MIKTTNSVMEITQLLSVYKWNKEDYVNLFLIPRKFHSIIYQETCKSFIIPQHPGNHLAILLNSKFPPLQKFFIPYQRCFIYEKKKEMRKNPQNHQIHAI